MKKITISLTLLLVFGAVSQVVGQINWSDQVVVNENTDLGFSRPKIVLSSEGTPVVMWSRVGNREVFISRMESDSFLEALQVSPKDMRFFTQDWAGPEMASVGNKIAIVYKSVPESSGYIYMVVSNNGGRTFSDTIRVSDTTLSRFPSVALDYQGNPHIAYMKFEEGYHNPKYVVVNSLDGGKTFSEEVLATESAPGEVCDCCPANIISSHNRLYLLFRNNDNNVRDIWIASSKDGGDSFDVCRDVDITDWNINVCPSSGPIGVIDEDSVVFTWMSGHTGKSRIRIGSVGQDVSTTYKNEELTESMFSASNQNFPKIDGKWETWGVTWQQSESGKNFILFRSTVNGYESLTGGKVDTVNQNIGGRPINPSMVYSNGGFHLTWQDNTTKKIYYRYGEVSSILSSDKLDFRINGYPNPTPSGIRLELPSSVKGSIKLYDNLGRQIQEFETEGAKTSQLPLPDTKGVYYVKWKSKIGESAVLKVLKY
jgi:hypothetical protein